MTDPIRLLDDPTAGASLRADLAHAQAAGLQGFDAAAGAAGLKAAIAAQATGTTVTAAATGAGATKALLGLAGVVTAGAIAWWALRPPSPQPDLAVAPVSARAEPAREAAPHPEPVVSPEPAVSAEPSRVVPQPVSVGDVPDEVPEAEAAPVAKVEPPPRKRAVPAPDPLRESKLISEARRVMRTEPKRALTLLEDAKSEFPRGLLREEREALTVLTLDRLGRTEQAQAAAKRFLEAYAQSPHADAVRQVIP